jgi:iron complex outermembrane recepter protein
MSSNSSSGQAARVAVAARVVQPTQPSKIKQSIRGLIVTGLFATFSLPVFAQVQTPATSNTTLDEVVVTGSRIKGITNADSASPISVITAEEIALTKATNLEDVLGNMTGVTLGSTIASNNGGGGASNVQLRDLGVSRTLILIDGQRLIPSFGVTFAVPDLNAVPISMVERIEVLRDGASSIYGADAIAGVVNIITKKHYEGVSMDVGYGAPTDSGGGGNSRNMSGSIGVNSDKGNVTVAASWDHIDPIQQAQRAWSTDPHQGASFGAGGSDYRSQLNVLQDEFSNNIWIGGTLYSLKNPATAGLVPNTLFLTAPKNALKLNAGAPDWNFLTQGIDRKQISVNSHYDIADNTRFVLEGFFTDRTSEGSLRPEPLLGDSIATTIFPGFFVPGYAPGNTTGVPITAFLTPDQFGPRQYDDVSQTYRIRTGFEGTFGSSGFNWEAGFVDQHNTTRNVTHNEGNFNHLAQITGQINCVDVPGGCSNATPAQLAESASQQSSLLVNPGPQTALVTRVPTVMPNFFNGPNMFTPAQVAYLTWDNTDVNTSTERYAYASINGPLFDLPAGPIRGAFGVEHRNEFAGDTPDLLVQEGYGPNQSQPTSGGYNASSVYAEFNIPIFKNAPFAQNLTVSPSGRYDKYNTFGDARTWKFGVEWTPFDQIRFRGAYSTGFRAPSVSELFAGQGISDITGDGDPCDTRAAGFNGNSNVGGGVLTAGSTCSKAVANGAAVTTFQSGNNNQTAQQQQVLQGGNPNLQPEKSSQYGLGFVLTPSATPGLSLAVDYYNIRIDNTVLTGGVVNATSVDAVLLGCYGPQQNQAYCALVHRAPGSGTIVQIDSLNDNFGTARVTGTDFELTYNTAKANWTLPFPGSFLLDLQAEEQYKNTQTNADGSLSSYVGFFQYSNENINPKWKGHAILEYTVGGWTAHWDTRFYEHMQSFDGGPDVYGNNIPNMWYHNISGSYTLKDVGIFKDTRFVLGVNNLLDKDPPFLSADSICKCNTLAGPFDLVGRFVYARISAKF